MKKYKVLMIVAIAAIAFAFTSCGNTDNGYFARIVEITGANVDDGLLNITVGETAQLKARIRPANTEEGAISWQSDRPEVATVENGVVTGKAKGEAVLFAIEEGDNGAIGQILVVVSEPSELPVTDGDPVDQGQAD
jgi:uncharacterized protein YjdB